MELCVNTKYDLEDIVYIAGYYYDYYADHKPYVINDIVANISRRGIRIMYKVEQNGIVSDFPEDWLFKTYDECKQWCDKQNKEG